jgi:hypothetical protein
LQQQQQQQSSNMSAQGNGGPQSGGGQEQAPEPNNIGFFLNQTFDRLSYASGMVPPPPPSLVSIDLGEEEARPPGPFVVEVEEAVEDGGIPGAWGNRAAVAMAGAKKAGKWMMEGWIRGKEREMEVDEEFLFICRAPSPGAACHLRRAGCPIPPVCGRVCRHFAEVRREGRRRRKEERIGPYWPQ